MGQERFTSCFRMAGNGVSGRLNSYEVQHVLRTVRYRPESPCRAHSAVNSRGTWARGSSAMFDLRRLSAMPGGFARRRVAARLSCALGAVVLMAAAAAPLAAAQTPGRSSPLVGQAAPDFTLRGLAGRNVRLSDHRGDVVLLGFWTSWCGGCKAELEQIARLNDTYRTAGLVVIGISLDDDRAKASAFAAAHGGTVLHVFDSAKATGKPYQIADVPMTMLVDRNGVVRFSHGEYSRRDEQDLVQQVRQLLDE